MSQEEMTEPTSREIENISSFSGRRMYDGTTEGKDYMRGIEDLGEKLFGV
jgi:hypothetical protein